MLASIEKMIIAYKHGKTHAKAGNHRFELVDGVARFYYHDTAICIVGNGATKYTAGNWAGYPSTTRAINSYKEYFDNVL